MRQKYSRVIFFVVTVLLLSGLVSTASAIQYDYDDLNRLTAAENDNGGTTQYQYDAGGNLLSVVTTDNAASRSLLPDNNIEDTVMEGWTPYFTAGVDAQYSLSSEVERGGMAVGNSVYGSTPEPSVTLGVYGTEEPSEFYPFQRITAEASVAGGANVYKDITVVGQQSYSIFGWIRAEQLQHSAAQIIVNFYDEKSRLIAYENVVNMLESSEWTDFSKTLTVPTGAITARVHLQLLLLDADGSGTANYAALSFEPYQIP